MLSVVVFKWDQPGYRSTFTAENVNTTRRMVARHYPHAHRFICVTDDPAGLDEGIEAIPLWDDFASIPNPTWVNGPSCYRRLKVFSNWFAELAGSGEKIVVLDLDVVITGDLSPLWDREDDFLAWKLDTVRQPICASMFMFQVGKMNRIWDDFDPEESPKIAGRQGFRGSDQAWMAYCVGRDAPGWDRGDGVYSYKKDVCYGKVPFRRAVGANLFIPSIYKVPELKRPSGDLPKGARVVMFTGHPDPWSPEAQRASPWIKDHYR